MILLLKNLLFTILVPGTVAVAVPLLLLRPGGAAPAAPWRLAAGLALAAGAAVYGRCVWDFARFGRGTPAPVDAPRRLVIRGLYRHVRNPMYLGVLLVIAGWSLAFASPRIAAYGACVALAFHLFTTLYEEPTLRRAFGADYEDYVRRVGRWLPRLRPGSRRDRAAHPGSARGPGAPPPSG